ncbi:MAG: hypothetical protein ABIY37_06650, partial [Devosia sp.]
MSMQLTETAQAAHPSARPRTEALLPPAIILLVFAMVVIAIGGFAYVGGQQNALNTLRGQSEAMREAASALSRTDASAAHVIAGDRDAMSEFFRNAEALRTLRPVTFDLIGGVTPSLDTLLLDWGEATTLAVDGHIDTARQLLAERQTNVTLDTVADAAGNAVADADAQFGQHEQRIQFFTLVVQLLQVLSGTLAIAAMFFAFRSSAREADGRSAALKSADTSREQVARLFQMADVLQSAADYGDANQVLKATAAELLPDFGGALYVFNNSRDRLVLSTSWGREGEAPQETIPPDQCWALKRGKPHL